MAYKVKALQTLMGSYGKADPGDILELFNQTARELAEKKLVEIIERTGPDNIERNLSLLEARKGKDGGGYSNTVLTAVPQTNFPF